MPVHQVPSIYRNLYTYCGVLSNVAKGYRKYQQNFYTVQINYTGPSTSSQSVAIAYLDKFWPSSPCRSQVRLALNGPITHTQNWPLAHKKTWTFQSAHSSQRPPTRY